MAQSIMKNQVSSNWSFELPQRQTIREITIKHGFIVDGIGFTILDGGGFTFETEWYGGQGGQTNKLTLKPDEIVTQVSGTLDDYEHDGRRHVSSLKIHTNLKPDGYGPYGKQKDTKDTTTFSSPAGGIVSGFYGAAGQYLDRLHAFVKTGDVLKFGPWGNQCQPNWNMTLANCEKIRKFSIYSGYLVDAIAFEIEGECGKYRKEVLGNPQASFNEKSLARNEYITRISGKQGVYAYDNQRHIGCITIHTNLCPGGYGPFGLSHAMEDISEFSSPSLTNYKITGFFGKAGRKYIDSIGVHMKKCGF